MRNVKHAQANFRKHFGILAQNRRAQCAQMTIRPGGCEGGPDNRHRGADQWLLVVAGRGAAVVNGRKYQLRKGSALLIERGDRHEIRNTGRSALQTLNIYLPPAYTKSGKELPRGKS